jgi:periplasmic copper chaperone A
MKRRHMMFAAALTALAAVAAASLPAIAGGRAADLVKVEAPFVRLTPPGQSTTGAFMNLKNADSRDHKLVSAASPAARVVELHEHTHEGGVMRMRPVKEILVKAKGETKLAPGGYHVMMIGLVKPLSDGELVPITLTFEDGSTLKLDAPARKP